MEVKPAPLPAPARQWAQAARTPDAVARVASAARQKGVLVRTLGQGVAVSPPLTVQAEQFGEIVEAIWAGLASL